MYKPKNFTEEADLSEAIVIRGLNQFYGKKQALFDLNLTIDRGMYGLLGRNGAGKTTLMKTLATLLSAKQGTIFVCGTSITHRSEIRRITGYLPQEFSMYPSMTVAETLDYLGVLSAMDKDSRKRRISQLLEQVNLTEHRNKRIKVLSGGMKRRLGIAQALLHDPKVLIVDEPTAGLDPEERIRFRNLLGAVAEDRIVILSTHIVGDVEASCQKIGILEQGRLLFDGTVEALLEKAEGKTFSCTGSKKELPLLKDSYTVTNVLTHGTECQVRFLAENGTLPQWTEPCPPNVEDAYMFCLHENGLLQEGGGLR